MGQSTSSIPLWSYSAAAAAEYRLGTVTIGTNVPGESSGAPPVTVREIGLINLITVIQFYSSTMRTETLHAPLQYGQ